MAFAKMIDAKDKYTNGHSIRVALYSKELAKRMGLPEEEQERFLLITDALMMNDLEDLKRVHNLANYLMMY